MLAFGNLLKRLTNLSGLHVGLTSCFGAHCNTRRLPVSTKPGAAAMLRSRAIFPNFRPAIQRPQQRYFLKTLFGFKDLTPPPKQTILERAQANKEVISDLTKGSWFRENILPFLLRRNRTIEHANSLIIYEKMVNQTQRPEFKALTLPPTFYTWIRLAFLHLWLVDVRFRYTTNARERDRLTQPLLDWLWEDIEVGLADTLNTTNSLVITKHSKRMTQEWFGAALAYDYGMITSDASLAEALHRNIYDADPNVPISELAFLVQYIREQQYVFDKLSHEELVSGEMKWVDPPFQTLGENEPNKESTQNPLPNFEAQYQQLLKSHQKEMQKKN